MNTLITDTEKQCDPASKDLVLVSVVIIGAVLFGIIIGFLRWIILKVPMCFVYERVHFFT